MSFIEAPDPWERLKRAFAILPIAWTVATTFAVLLLLIFDLFSKGSEFSVVRSDNPATLFGVGVYFVIIGSLFAGLLPAIAALAFASVFIKYRRCGTLIVAMILFLGWAIAFTRSVVGAGEPLAAVYAIVIAYYFWKTLPVPLENDFA